MKTATMTEEAYKSLQHFKIEHECSSISEAILILLDNFLKKKEKGGSRV